LEERPCTLKRQQKVKALESGGASTDQQRFGAEGKKEISREVKVKRKATHKKE